MRVVHASFVRPRGHDDPDRLLTEWPTLIDVAAAVVDAGLAVTLVQSFARDAVVERRGVTCRFVREPAFPGFSSGFAPHRLAQAAAASGADVIHVNGLDFPGHTRAMCATGIPVLAQDHASRAGGRRLRRAWGLARVAAAAFTDAAQARPFVAEGSLRRDVPIYSVPESSTRFTPGDQAEARAATGLQGDPAVLWVGRLDANKDPLTVLDAIEIAAASLPGLQLWCCFHEQPLMAHVRRRIDASAVLKERVHLIGRVPHARIEQLCRAADIFMLASHREGSGYALIEALACGATPVVSDIPSFRRLVGNAGALAAPGDASAFAAALVDMARKPRAEQRRKALAQFETNLSFGSLGRQWREVYRAIARPTS
jgi:glycosyltransferase involved in cell wall biosynthesis